MKKKILGNQKGIYPRVELKDTYLVGLDYANTSVISERKEKVAPQAFVAGDKLGLLYYIGMGPGQIESQLIRIINWGE